MLVTGIFFSQRGSLVCFSHCQSRVPNANILEPISCSCRPALLTSRWPLSTSAAVPSVGTAGGTRLGWSRCSRVCSPVPRIDQLVIYVWVNWLSARKVCSWQNICKLIPIVRDNFWIFWCNIFQPSFYVYTFICSWDYIIYSFVVAVLSYNQHFPHQL